MAIGMPTTSITFQAAAQAVTARLSAGYVAVLVRDPVITAVSLLWTRRVTDVPTKVGAAALSADTVANIKRTFTGSARGAPSRVLLVFVPPESGETTNFASALHELRLHDVDYIVPPVDLTTEESTDLLTWVEEQRTLNKPYKVLLPNTAANKRFAINVAMDGTVVPGTEAGTTVTMTSAQLLSRVAGVLAGVPMSMSVTAAVFDEVLDVQTFEDDDAEVDAGKLFLVHNGRNASIARGVTSLTTTPEDGHDSWKKIKILAALDLIASYANQLFESARGTRPNDYANKMILVGELRAYFVALEGEGALQAGRSTADVDASKQEAWMKEQGIDTSTMTDQEIREYSTGDYVWLTAAIAPLDAMESFALDISTLI